MKIRAEEKASRRLFLYPALISSLILAYVGDAEAQSSGKAFITCDPTAPRALTARPSDLKTEPKGHWVEGITYLRLTEAKYVEGPCTQAIVIFIAGHARLPSGDAFVVKDDGTVFYFASNANVDHSPPVRAVRGLPGYKLLTVAGVARKPSPEGDRSVYLGLFKSKSDYLIARFDMVNGTTSKTAHVLIRAKQPISSLGSMPAYHEPSVGIGFVQHAGPNKAWLYAYSWQHGHLEPLEL